MAKKLYVGNLSYETTSEQLKELFTQVGEVTEISLITDRDTGRSKGFGFIEMATETNAQEAIRRFDGHVLNDRALTVNEARPREDRSGGSFGGGGGGYGGGSKPRNNFGGNKRNRY
jgi:RNA recognition motif-containing protein